nr:hypothetical protein [Actinomycetota bacterium]
MRDIRVATVQFQHAPGDKEHNLDRVRHFAAEAARAGAEIVCFPEMCLTGYWHVRKLDRAAFEALAEHVRAGRIKRVALERIDGVPILEGAYGELLIELGFRQSPRALTLSA